MNSVNDNDVQFDIERVSWADDYEACQKFGQRWENDASDFLTAHGVDVVRSKYDLFDFYVPSANTYIECKSRYTPFYKAMEFFGLLPNFAVSIELGKLDSYLEFRQKNDVEVIVAYNVQYNELETHHVGWTYVKNLPRFIGTKTFTHHRRIREGKTDQACKFGFFDCRLLYDFFDLPLHLKLLKGGELQ